MSKTVDAGGVKLAYEVSGSGPALLCIQGVGVAGCGWRPQVTRLRSHYQLITFDNRGIGAASSLPFALSIEAMAADALAIMDAEGIERFHVMGHSLGGLVAQRLALEARRRVQSLMLLCTFANGKDATALSWRMLALTLRARIGTRTARRNGMLRMIMPDDYLRGLDRDRLAQDLCILFGREIADQPPIVMAQLRAMRRYSAVPELGRLAGLPTLVVSGKHDPIAPPRLGHALAHGIPGARFVEFQQASHALPIQCADELHLLLVEHLRSVDATL
jgi:pimeloyl-ACP methyl ester carboxylesterase